MNEYIKTDQQIHWLCQTITKANRTFVPAKADDSHTNLFFDSLGNRIVGRWIETEKGQMLLTLNMANLQFEWINSAYQSVTSFKTIGKEIDAVEIEIAENLGKMGLSSNGFADKLHYEIPDYPFTDEAVHPIAKQHLDEWIYFRNLANKVCTVLLGYLQIEGEIRIWPHHFDTGIYVVTNDGTGIGFGLAMSDSMVGGPYFYMTGYPAEGTLAYTGLVDLPFGKWVIQSDWNGSVLSLEEFGQLPEAKQMSAIEDFMVSAVSWFLK